MANGQSAGRKFGRNRDRSKAMGRYTSMGRDKINKAKKVAKHERFVAACEAKKDTITPHGAKRAERRENIHAFKNWRRYTQRKDREAGIPGTISCHVYDGKGHDKFFTIHS